MASIPDAGCSIARSLAILGERWTLLIIRDAIEGFSRFEEFRRSLGVAPDILTARLTTLVDHGVMTKVDYQEPGQRRRSEYLLTDAGLDLLVVIAGLQQWGDRHHPYPAGPTLLRIDHPSGDEIHVGFIGSRGEVPSTDVRLEPTPTYSRERLEARRQSSARSRHERSRGGAGRPTGDPQ